MSDIERSACRKCQVLSDSTHSSGQVWKRQARRLDHQSDSPLHGPATRPQRSLHQGASCVHCPVACASTHLRREAPELEAWVPLVRLELPPSRACCTRLAVHRLRGRQRCTHVLA